MLCDPAGLAGRDVGLADAVEQAGLAVIDVAQDGHDGRAGSQVFAREVGALELELLERGRRLEDGQLDSALHCQKLSKVGVDLGVERRHRALRHQLRQELIEADSGDAAEVLQHDRLGDLDALGACRGPKRNLLHLLGFNGAMGPADGLVESLLSLEQIAIAPFAELFADVGAQIADAAARIGPGTCGGAAGGHVLSLFRSPVASGRAASTDRPCSWR